MISKVAFDEENLRLVSKQRADMADIVAIAILLASEAFLKINPTNLREKGSEP